MNIVDDSRCEKLMRKFEQWNLIRVYYSNFMGRIDVSFCFINIFEEKRFNKRRMNSTHENLVQKINFYPVIKILSDIHQWISADSIDVMLLSFYFFLLYFSSLNSSFNWRERIYPLSIKISAFLVTKRYISNIKQPRKKKKYIIFFKKSFQKLFANDSLNDKLNEKIIREKNLPCLKD